MRITRPGLPANVKRYEAKCPSCLGEFEFVGSEAKRVKAPNGGEVFKLRCPCCWAVVTTEAAS
jgi:hypothetical protein